MARQYKIVESNNPEYSIVGKFTSNEDMSTYAFARDFCNCLFRMAKAGYKAIPLCKDCGAMLKPIAIKQQVYEGDPNPDYCDKCGYI